MMVFPIFLKTINIYGPKNLSDHVGLITVNVEGMSPEDVGSILMLALALQSGRVYTVPPRSRVWVHHRKGVCGSVLDPLLQKMTSIQPWQQWQQS